MGQIVVDQNDSQGSGKHQPVFPQDSSRSSFSQWMPAGAMFLVSLISYVDRNILAILAPVILKDTHLSVAQYGLIVSAFSFAYMVGNPFWGRMLDVIGLRRGMTAAVSIWSVASVCHFFARGFYGFATARLVLGFGEGATFPGGFRTVAQTLPKSAHGRGTGLAYSGGSLGAVLTPLVVTPIFIRWGWHAAFLFSGAMGAAWLCFWAFLSRGEGFGPQEQTAGERYRGPDIRDKRVWAIVSAYALGVLPLGFVLYDSSLYLSRVFGSSQVFIGKVLWIPPLGWEIGYLLWGYAIDQFVSRGIPRLKAVRYMMFVAMILSLPLAITPLEHSVWTALFQMTFSVFVTTGFTLTALTYGMEVYTAKHAGFVAGIGAGSWGAAVAVFMPMFGRLFDIRRYDLAFGLAAVLPVFGFLGWLILQRRASPAIDVPERS